MDPSHAIIERAKDTSGYPTYYTGMDASLLQKLAAMTAHLKVHGARIVDLGFGTGGGTFGLSQLYPGNEIEGLDIDPQAIAHARRKYQNPNLLFRQGDITTTTFQPGTVDAFLNFSFLHEVTSYFPDPRLQFTPEPIKRSLKEQATALRDEGFIVIHDFVKPSRAERKVLLDLPTSQGDPTENQFTAMSKADLFLDFCSRFRCMAHPEGVDFTEKRSPRPGWRRFEVDLLSAVEFILRKDYTKRWLYEIKEQYLYFTQKEFEQSFGELGLRVVQSTEIHNPWIERNRFANQFGLRELNGEEIPFPATNYHGVAQKVAKGNGIVLTQTHRKLLKDPNFIQRESFINMNPESLYLGHVYEVLQRPNEVVDVLLWTSINERLHVFVRRGYPRPIIGSINSNDSLDGSTAAGYLIENINGALKGSLKELLQERVGNHSEDISEGPPALSFLTSASTLNEQIRLYTHMVSPNFVNVCGASPAYSGFSTSGEIQPMDAQQLLRTAQIGGLFEGRAEAGTYSLLEQHDTSPLPWIGEKVTLKDQSGTIYSTSLAEMEQQRVSFKPFNGRRKPFFNIYQGQFVEKDGAAAQLTSKTLEYISPRTYTDDLILCLPVIKIDGEIYVGLEDKDLPAAQLNTGSSQHITAPLFRITKDTKHFTDARDKILLKFEKEFGVSATNVFQLGGAYFSSPGICRERIYPLLVEVDLKSTTDTPGRSNLYWVKLSDLYQNTNQIKDFHLLLATFRANHAIHYPS